jgi:hypothetical protein
VKIQLEAQLFSINAAGPDGVPRRVVEGVAIPWNVEAIVASGQRVKFLPGSLPTDGPNPKFILGHDMTKPLGMVNERVSTPDAMLFSAALYDTNLANETLLQAGPGQFYDSVSVGVEPTDYSFEGSTMVVKAGTWTELSLLPFGAFEGAKVAVAAEAPETQDPTPTDSEEEPEVATQETPDTVEAAVPTQLIYAAPKREFKLPSPAEYISSYLKGGHEFAQMHENIRAAAPDVITTDTPGILPTPILSPVYNNFRGLRPVVDAIGAKAMPAGGKIFIRPEVTTHTSMAVQSAENAALQSGTFVVFNNQVTKNTYGGYVTISEQDLDWTDPAVLSLVLDDMGRIYANQTDDVAADALVAGATTTAVLTDANLLLADKVVAFVYDAAATILSASNGNLPTHLFLSSDTFASLGKLSDSSLRPLFPQTGPMNAYGSMSPASVESVAFGLRVVVDRNFAAKTMIVGDASGFEIFEQQKGAISIDNPSTLSRTVAFRGYFATLMIDPTKFVKRVTA